MIFAGKILKRLTWTWNLIPMEILYAPSVSLIQEACKPQDKVVMKYSSTNHAKRSYFFLINSIFFIISLLYNILLSEVYGDSETIVSHTFSFSNITCTGGIGNVLLIGQFNNNDTFYRVIFLKMLLHDKNGQILATGNGNISNIKPHETKAFNAITRFSGNFSSCTIQIDNTIPK